MIKPRIILHNPDDIILLAVTSRNSIKINQLIQFNVVLLQGNLKHYCTVLEKKTNKTNSITKIDQHRLYCAQTYFTI